MKRYIFKFKRKSKAIKYWLENNRIYFETILMLVLTVMGLIVSYNANTISQKANEIMEYDLKMSQEDKLPYFSKWYDLETDRRFIVNSRGEIKNVFSEFQYFEVVKLSSNEKEKTLIFEIENAFDLPFAIYDYENDRLEVPVSIVSVRNVMQDIQNEIIKQNIDLSYYNIQLIKINYCDYINEMREEYYADVGDLRLWLLPISEKEVSMLKSAVTVSLVFDDWSMNLTPESNALLRDVIMDTLTNL